MRSDDDGGEEKDRREKMRNPRAGQRRRERNMVLEIGMRERELLE